MQYTQQVKLSLFILGLSIVTLGANQLSVLAQTRQPTKAETSKLRQEFQQFIRSTQNNRVGAGYIQDRRTPSEKISRDAFVRDWSKIEPGIAPFMGVWYGYEDVRHIYPSSIKGHVCVIATNEAYTNFDVAVLSNGVIQTNGGQLLFKEGNYLGLASLNNGKFVSSNGEIPLHSPRPLEPLTKLLNYVFESSDKSQLSQQFQAAGCTLNLPNSSANSQSKSNINITNNQQLPPELVKAIRQDFINYREDFGDYFKDLKTHKVFFVDLNNDRIKEAILYPIGGRICNNRSCPIYIYSKVGDNYKRISDIKGVNNNYNSTIYGSRNEPSIGILNTSNQGWNDIATRYFDYDTRTEKWSKIRYGIYGYSGSDQVTVSTPKTILQYSSGVETDFRKFLSP